MKKDNYLIINLSTHTTLWRPAPVLAGGLLGGEGVCGGAGGGAKAVLKIKKFYGCLYYVTNLRNKNYKF